MTLKLHHLLGPKAPAQTKMLMPWAEKIQADSGGRVKIEIYPAMSLGGTPADLFKQARDGVVDIVWTVNGYTAGLFPRSEVFELATVYTNNIIAANLAMREMFDEYLAEEYRDVHVLFNHVHAGQALHMADTPVRSPADLVGKKLRVPGPTGIAIIEQLGATPVPMPVPDLPQALMTHAVDGALIPWEIIPALKLQDSTKYQIEGENAWRFGTTTFQVSMNKAVWDGLPDDLKEVFSKNSDEAWLKRGRRDLARLRRRRHQDRGRCRQRAHRAHARGDGGLQHGARAGRRQVDRRLRSEGDRRQGARRGRARRRSPSTARELRPPDRRRGGAMLPSPLIPGCAARSPSCRRRSSIGRSPAGSSSPCSC